MREILFRGKRTDNGGWVYGSPVFQDGYVLIRFWNGEEFEFEEYLVSPETISEFSGLTDKNGKKIFEGDIVAGAVHWLERMKNGFVAFKDGSFGLIWYRGEVEQFNPFTSMCNVEYEVIGNIHDNSELLKGGDGK